MISAISRRTVKVNEITYEVLRFICLSIKQTKWQDHSHEEKTGHLNNVPEHAHVEIGVFAGIYYIKG